MKQMAEAISKYDIMGHKNVKLDELMALIHVMRRKYREATEPCYIHQNDDQRIAADLSLNHLCVILNKEEIGVETMMRVLKTRIEREEKEQATRKEDKPKAESKPQKHCPGRYSVWYRTDEDTTQHFMGFVRFEKGIPVSTNRPCKATWFVWRGMAEKVAEITIY